MQPTKAVSSASAFIAYSSFKLEQFKKALEFILLKLGELNYSKELQFAKACSSITPRLIEDYWSSFGKNSTFVSCLQPTNAKEPILAILLP